MIDFGCVYNFFSTVHNVSLKSMNCKFSTKYGFSKQPTHRSRKEVFLKKREIMPFSKFIQKGMIGSGVPTF